jgi:hypothetical protein
MKFCASLPNPGQRLGIDHPVLVTADATFASGEVFAAGGAGIAAQLPVEPRHGRPTVRTAIVLVVGSAVANREVDLVTSPNAYIADVLESNDRLYEDRLRIRPKKEHR